MHLNEGVNDLLRRDLVLTNRTVQRRHIVLVQQLSHLSHNLRAHHLLQRQLTVTHALGEHLAAGEQRLQAAFLREVLADLRASA